MSARNRPVSLPDAVRLVEEMLACWIGDAGHAAPVLIPRAVDMIAAFRGETPRHTARRLALKAHHESMPAIADRHEDWSRFDALFGEESGTNSGTSTGTSSARPTAGRAAD